MQKSVHTMRKFFTILMVLVAVWLLGLGYFYGHTRAGHDAEDMDKMDGIIVLTGGAGRIEAGLGLLEKGLADRMLITGVNPVVSTHTLAKLSGREPALFHCCIDLGTKAADTRGNASEAADWTNDHNIKSFYLVTAHYHVPRAMLHFKSRIPGATIHAFPVEAPVSVGYLITEYHKYLVTVIRDI